MPAATLSESVRYYPVGVRQYYIVPAIANINSPTRTELDAGTDVTDQIVDGGISGFMESPATLDTPDAGRRFTSNIDARTSVQASTINFYTTSDGSTDVRDLLTKALNTFVVIFPEGDHPPVVGPPARTFHCEVWPSRVITDPAVDTDMSKPGQVQITFANTGQPAHHVAVPS